MRAPAEFPPPRGVARLAVVGAKLGTDHGMSEATYLYGLVRAPRRPRSRRLPRGCPASRRCGRSTPGGGLWLLVAGAPLAGVRRRGDPAPALRPLLGLRPRPRPRGDDRALLRRRARCLPMKLFTLFASDERAVAYIRERPGAARTGCSTGWTGRVEWGVRVRLDDARAREVLAAEAQAERTLELGQGLPAAQEAGAGRLPRARRPAPRRDGRRLRRAGRGGLRGGPPRARGLAGVRRPAAARRRLPRPPGARARSSRPWSSGAPSRLAPRACDVTLTGPWPPYNFIAESP